MGKLTIHELLKGDPEGYHEELAERVGAVLTLIDGDPEVYEDAKGLAMAIRSALDGAR